MSDIQVPDNIDEILRRRHFTGQTEDEKRESLLKAVAENNAGISANQREWASVLRRAFLSCSRYTARQAGYLPPEAQVKPGTTYHGPNGPLLIDEEYPL